MPNPSSILMADDWNEEVDAELMPAPPTDLQLVIATARRTAFEATQGLRKGSRAHIRASGASQVILDACDRLEAGRV